MKRRSLNWLPETGDRVKRGKGIPRIKSQVTYNITVYNPKTIVNFPVFPTGTGIQREKGGIIMNEIRKFPSGPRLKTDRHLLTLVKKRARAGRRVSIERMREITGKIKGSMSEAIVEERDRERC